MTLKSPTLSHYQKATHDLAKKFKFNWSNYVQYVHLVEEVGELGEALTVHQGDRQSGSGESALADHADLNEEFGDILFAVFELANQLDINLDQVTEHQNNSPFANPSLLF